MVVPEHVGKAAMWYMRATGYLPVSEFHPLLVVKLAVVIGIGVWPPGGALSAYAGHACTERRSGLEDVEVSASCCQLLTEVCRPGMSQEHLILLRCM